MMFSFRPGFALLVLLITLASRPSISADEALAKIEPSTPATHTIGRRVSHRGLPNFGEVTPTLFRGALPSNEGLARLAKMRVAIVVDLRSPRSESEARAVEKLGMQYVSIPWHCPFPRDESFARFLALVRANRSEKLFVHCRLGNDRTGMAIAAYRMSEEKWPADQAMKEMQAFGFKSFHRAICPGLAGYEKSFPEHLKSSAAFEALRSDARSGVR